MKGADAPQNFWARTAPGCTLCISYCIVWDGDWAKETGGFLVGGVKIHALWRYGG